MDILNHQIGDVFIKALNLQEQLIEEIIREYATPKIKGDITIGKIRWRGLKLVTYGLDIEQVLWVEQRGERIGPKITFDKKIIVVDRG